MDNPHRLQLLHTPCHVGVGIVVGNMGNTNHDAIRVAMMQKPFQILDNPCIVFSGIRLVDSRVHILDIHHIAVQYGISCLHLFGRHVQTGFDQQFPPVTTQCAEFLDKLGLQQRFAPAEGNPSTGSKKIQLVYLDLLKE